MINPLQSNLEQGILKQRKEHESVQLHIEWKSPIENKGEGQTRGNSGIIFQGRYEVQGS